MTVGTNILDILVRTVRSAILATAWLFVFLATYIIRDN